MDYWRLRANPRRVSNAHGKSRRCLRSEENLHCRDCPFHHRFDGRRSRPIPLDTDRLQGIAGNRSGHVNGDSLCNFHTNIPRRTPKKQGARGSSSRALGRIRSRAVAGGALTVAFGWRSVMFVNVPIGVVAAVLSQRFLPKTEGWLKNQRLDVPGAITVTLGTILPVFGLTNAATSGFDSLDTIVPLGLSGLVLASFLVVESRSTSPLIPPAFLKRGSVLTANTLALVLTSTVGGVSFIITIYLQNILGYSPLYAGLGTLPSAVIFFLVGGWGASRVMNRLGARRTLLVSTGLATVGIALLTM